jgi:Fic family protein
MPNAKIEQIKNASVPVGITDMIALQIKMMEEVSGVSGALQGQAPKSGTPSSLYLQQTQNSSSSLMEIFESFRELRESRDLKNLKLVQQYYTEKRIININGSSNRIKSITYNPELVRDVSFDLSITESTSTASYRQIINDMLLQFWQAGAINLKQMLENGAFPFADKLLQSIEADQTEAQNQAMQQGINPEVAEQIYSQANPQAMEIINKGLRQ